MMKNIFKNLFLFSFGIGLLGIITVVSVVVYFSFGLPNISNLDDYNPPIPSQILAKDGTVLAEIGEQKRYVSKFDEIPVLVVNAFTSAEDDNFFEHTGVDYLGVLRALYVNIRKGRVVQGGSTITQQVAKSLLLSRERSISRKIKDFLLALRIEKRFTKEEILFLYLNQVYLGGGYYGVKAAFKGYFGKELNEATVAESAIVAGLLVAPGRYSPYIMPRAAFIRQRYVLGRMYKNGKIAKEQYEEALAEKIKFRIRRGRPYLAPYFVDWIRQKVIKEVGEKEFLKGGYTIKTTLDWKLQELAEKEVIKGTREVEKRRGFKGAEQHLIGREEFAAFERKSRENIYEKKSNYFTINKQFQREKEYILSNYEIDALDNYKMSWNAKVKNNKLRAGLVKDERLLDLLEKRKLYKGIVTYVDDEYQLIHLSIAGLSGIIPLKYFKWAHKREISERRHYFNPVDRPSRIVQKGDVIYTSIIEKEISFTKVLSKKMLKKIKKNSHWKMIKEEKYLLCSLEQKTDVQGSLFSIDPKLEEIVAFVGGTNFGRSQFNRVVQALRQPGSSFKPLLFAAALENGYTPSTIIMDTPEALGGVGGLSWKPRNYDGKFKGPMTFRNALEQSRNIPTIKIAAKLGVRKVTKFVKRIGLEGQLDQDLSFSLGAFGVSLKDIVTAYAIFPTGGRRVFPKGIISITDRRGDLVDFDEKKDTESNEKEYDDSYLTGQGENQVYDEKLAYIMTNILKGVVLHGTGRRARSISPYIAGKTGTTNDYVDAWFIGFSSKLVTGVWVGLDDNRTLGFGETGAKSSLPIWKAFMKAGIDKFGEEDFMAPAEITNLKVNKETGLAVSSGQEGFMESFLVGTEPGHEEIIENIEDANIDANRPLEEDDYFSNQ